MSKDTILTKEERKEWGKKLRNCLKAAGIKTEDSIEVFNISKPQLDRYLSGAAKKVDRGKMREFVQQINDYKKLSGHDAFAYEYVIGLSNYMTIGENTRAFQEELDSSIEGPTRVFTQLLRESGVKPLGYYGKKADSDADKKLKIYNKFLRDYEVYEYVPIDDNPASNDYLSIANSPYYQIELQYRDDNAHLVLSGSEYDALIEETIQFIRMRMNSIKSIHDDLDLFNTEILQGFIEESEDSVQDLDITLENYTEDKNNGIHNETR